MSPKFKAQEGLLFYNNKCVWKMLWHKTGKSFVLRPIQYKMKGAWSGRFGCNSSMFDCLIMWRKVLEGEPALPQDEDTEKILQLFLSNNKDSIELSHQLFENLVFELKSKK